MTATEMKTRRTRKALVDERSRTHEIAPGVRLGRGSIVEYDARVGIPANGSARAGELTIGPAAMIRGGAAIYMGCDIGREFEAGFNVVVSEDTFIGDRVRIGHNTVIGRGCTIGDRVLIDENCSIGQSTTIEEGAHIAHGVSMAHDPHPGSATTYCARGPIIGRGSQIGSNATILPFVSIGEYALVAAGSVVTTDVAPGAVVAGNPALQTKTVADVACPLDVRAGEYLRPVSRATVA